jgi:hypothetical protein
MKNCRAKFRRSKWAKMKILEEKKLQAPKYFDSGEG